MNRFSQFACGIVVIMAVVGVGAAEPARAPQYRYRDRSIAAATATEPVRSAFSAESARQHLDLGVTLWARQKRCVSCHTHGIYMITRPELASVWGKPDKHLRAFMVEQARQVIDSGESTGSAPAKLAYIARGLAEWDAHVEQKTSPETDAALRHVLAIQSADGSLDAQYRWPPLNSDRYHATIMAAMAIATAPDWRSAQLQTELRGPIEKLESYLRQTPPKHDHQRLLLLWASTRISNLVDAQRRRQLLDRIWRQQRNDGGWSLRTFATPAELGGGKQAQKLLAEPDYQHPTSDGYQTGLAVVVLRDAGIAADDARLQNAVQWLLANQRESGRWWTRSLNVDSRFHYVSFSGTAYASLALAKCGAIPKRPANR